MSTRLLKGIRKGYLKNSREEEIVQEIANEIINNEGKEGIGKFNTKGNDFEITTNAIFIHGARSHVEFEYCGSNVHRELGDIIFILSVIYKGKKYFEKMTINQVKKSKSTSWRLSNSSAKEQLYLLSRFPTFKGVRNLLIRNDRCYNLLNVSGCLGTHGLIYSPDDFALISSKELDMILLRKNKHSIELNDVLELITPNNTTYPCFPCHLLYGYRIDFEECIFNLHKLLYRHSLLGHPLPCICNLPILGNNCVAYNVYDFSKKCLVGHIGELIYAKNFSYNQHAFRFLQDLLSEIKKKVEKERLKEALDFISSFYKYEYAEGRYNNKMDREYDEDKYYEGGNIGIIHTIVDLGESK